MVFSSITFVFYFLPLFFIFYYAAGAKNGALLLGSTVFYTWGEGIYLLLLIAFVVVNFYIGSAVAKFSDLRRIFVIFGIAINLFVLGIFKYIGFFARTAEGITGIPLPIGEIHLPLGISFFTFQLISYLVDIDRQNINPEKDIIRFRYIYNDVSTLNCWPYCKIHGY